MGSASDRKPITKHQMSAKVFLLILFEKRRDLPGLFPFQKETSIKNLGWRLVLINFWHNRKSLQSIWCCLYLIMEDTQHVRSFEWRVAESRDFDPMTLNCLPTWITWDYLIHLRFQSDYYIFTPCLGNESVLLK